MIVLAVLACGWVEAGPIAFSITQVAADGFSPDINDLEEIVYGSSSDSDALPQIFSTVRGQLTTSPNFRQAFRPRINPGRNGAFLADFPSCGRTPPAVPTKFQVPIILGRNSVRPGTMTRIMIRTRSQNRNGGGVAMV